MGVINLSSSDDETAPKASEKSNSTAPLRRGIMSQFGRPGGRDSISSQQTTGSRTLRQDVEPARQYQPSSRSREGSGNDLIERLKSSTSSSPGFASRHPYGAPPSNRSDQSRRHSPGQRISSKEGSSTTRHVQRKSSAASEKLSSARSSPRAAKERQRNKFNPSVSPSNTRYNAGTVAQLSGEDETALEVTPRETPQQTQKENKDNTAEVFNRTPKKTLRGHARNIENTPDEDKARLQTRSATKGDGTRAKQPLTESNLTATISKEALPAPEVAVSISGSDSGTSPLTDLSSSLDDIALLGSASSRDQRPSSDDSSKQTGTKRKLSSAVSVVADVHTGDNSIRSNAFKTAELPIHGKNNMPLEGSEIVQKQTITSSPRRSLTPVDHATSDASTEEVVAQNTEQLNERKVPADLRSHLEDLHQTLKEDVALTAMFSLYDASRMNRQHARSAFVDPVSPWQNMEPIALQKVAGLSTVKLESRVS
jgi:hypothetical protein